MYALKLQNRVGVDNNSSKDGKYKNKSPSMNPKWKLIIKYICGSGD